MIAVLDDRISVARKAHICNLCQQTIDIGERHQVTRWVDGGQFGYTRDHLACRDSYWPYWKWLGWEPHHVDTENDFPDVAEFRQFLTRVDDEATA